MILLSSGFTVLESILRSYLELNQDKDPEGDEPSNKIERKENYMKLSFKKKDSDLIARSKKIITIKDSRELLLM